MTETHHAISYVEIAVDDLPATRSFYERAFGWQFTDYGPTYSAIRSPGGDAEVGGLNAEAAPTRGGPLVLVHSRDLEATLDAVRAAGGDVTSGPYAYPGGRRFHFSDPSGNELGVYTPS